MKIKLTNKAVEALRFPPGDPRPKIVVWADVPKVSVRVSKTGSITYFVQARVSGGKERNVALDRHKHSDAPSRLFPAAIDIPLRAARGSMG
jgi:hypothetical protein